MTRFGSFLVAAAIATLWAPPAHGQIPDGSTRMVDVHGSELRVMTLGLEGRVEGEPVLVLQAGAGSPMETWGALIPLIAEMAPVVTYDRPGIGQSPYDGNLPTVHQSAEQLHELLGVLEVPPPYVLVGHSWGGPRILFHAEIHPDGVVGMVYVDPTSPTMGPDDMLPKTEDEGVRAAARAEMDAFMDAFVANAPEGLRAEYASIQSYEAMPLADRGIPDPPDVPTAIILGALFEEQPGPSFLNRDLWREFVQERIEQFGRWVTSLPEATLIVASDAGHYVHRYDPGLVADAIEDVLFPDITSHLARVYETRGLEAVSDAWAVVKRRYPAETINEFVLNTLGYQLLGRGLVDEAIVVFEMNVAEYPEASNPWDSLAEGYMTKGDREKAIEYYRKSLALNPNNQNAVQQLEKLGAGGQAPILEDQRVRVLEAQGAGIAPR